MYNYTNAFVAYFWGNVLFYFLIALIVCVIFGITTRSISHSKGYSGGFWWGFLLNWLGIIVVLCKPQYSATSSDEQGGNFNYGASAFKPSYVSVEKALLSGRIVNKIAYINRSAVGVNCPSCGMNQYSSNMVCGGCGIRFEDIRNIPEGDAEA